MSTVLPSAERATLAPKFANFPDASFGVSFSTWVQLEPERANTQAAPGPEALVGVLPSLTPPTRAVFPSADNATPAPKFGFPDASPAVSLACRVQVEPERVNTNAAPMPPSSEGSPTSAVSPFAEIAMLQPASVPPGPV